MAKCRLLHTGSLVMFTVACDLSGCMGLPPPCSSCNSLFDNGIDCTFTKAGCESCTGMYSKNSSTTATCTPHTCTSCDEASCLTYFCEVEESLRESFCSNCGTKYAEAGSFWYCGDGVSSCSKLKRQQINGGHGGHHAGSNFVTASMLLLVIVALNV